MDIVNVIAIILPTILAIVYGYFKYSYTYWKSRGVPCDEPSIPYGNFNGLGKTQNNHEVAKRMYDKYKPTGVKVCGIYYFVRPIAIILDVELIKRILIEDFNNFVDRNVNDPTSAHLDGEQCQKLTSSKIKFVFPTVVQVAERFRDYLFDAIGKQSAADRMNGLEIKELCECFMTDMIGTCVFGIEWNTLKDENAEFRRICHEMASNSRHDKIPEFIMKTVNETIKYRETNGVQRNDLMDIFIKLKIDKALTVNEIAAQMFVFFTAGLNSSATAFTFCLYELAIHFDVQCKARTAIKEAYSKYNGQLTYDMLMDIPYIDRILEEILRMYGSAAFLMRKVKNDYLIPGTDIVLKKGVEVMIPLRSIHNDLEYYPDPQLFDPDRFNSDGKTKRNTMTWLPIGSGPRNFGTEFAMMQIKIGLIRILENFVISMSAKTKLPRTVSRNEAVCRPQDDIYLKFRSLKS